MKFIRRCCLPLALSLVLSVAFLTPVNAEDSNEYSNYKIVQTTESGVLTFYPYDNETTKQEWNYSAYNDYNDSQRFYIYKKDGSHVAKASGKLNVTVDHLYTCIYSHVENTYKLYPYHVSVFLHYANGSSLLLQDSEVNIEYVSDRTANISFECTPTDDVTHFEILYSWYSSMTSTRQVYTAYLGEWGPKDVHIEVSEESGVTGFISGILETLRNVFEKVKEMAQTLIDLPQQIGYWVQDAVYYLFIPGDEATMTWVGNMKSLLEDRLGAVYQVISITFESWESITGSDIQNSIEFPYVSIDLPDGAVFSFGGYEVKVVPDGFEFLVSACKVVIGVICTCWFVNGLRKRYDEIMGVEQ